MGLSCFAVVALYLHLEFECGFFFFVILYIAVGLDSLEVFSIFFSIEKNAWFC